MATPAPYRLPRTVLPERYEIHLEPDLDAARFEGRLRIAVDVREATGTVVLNAAELVVTEARLTPGGGTARNAEVSLDGRLERVSLGFAEPVPAGPATIDLRFAGVLNDDLRGFYRSTFVDDAGATRVIATTQFESTDARRAFPCWDEPDMKATFALTLVVGAGLTALSSGREEHTEALADGRRLVRFAETMRMSTYVLAWVIGPFDLTAPVDVDGVPLRLAAAPGRLPLTPFGVEVAAHALRHLSSYFGLAYPSDKVDHVAIPDFAFGAMENLGCVTYRESALLADLDVASQLELMRVARVICHETAHMWFGDLVTMRWWNGIWLNEAFATFMELKATEAYRPDWQVWTAFGAGKAAALATDGLRATRPIEIEVGPPEEAEAMFDVLTYQKGGAVLRMLEQYLGEEPFRRGIARYLRDHQHANTETTDLWDALEAASGEPVRATMESWIGQGGYPLVGVEGGADGSSIVLAQRRFLYAGEAEGSWSVPVNLKASVGGRVVRRRVLLGETTRIDLGGPIDWVIVNEGGWGFYRVHYTPALIDRVVDAGLQEVCDPRERLGIVSDRWAEVVNGSADLASWVELVEGLGAEEDPDVWLAVTGPMVMLDHVASDADRPTLTEWIGRVLRPVFDRLGWEPAAGETERTAITRGRVIAALGTVGADPAVRAEATERLLSHESDRTALAPDVLGPAISVAAAAGGHDTFEHLIHRYRTAATPQDKVRFNRALADFPDADLHARALALAMSPEVRSQDGPFYLADLLANRHSSAAAWSWVQASWEAITARFPRNLLIRLFEGVAGFYDAELVAAAHDFFRTADLPVRGPRLAQLEERMDVNLAFAGRVRPELGKVLARR